VLINLCYIAKSGFGCDNGKHKIVVLKEKRYELLKEVHDILGHKKIYTMQMQLLE
jgi:hypothetical protein